MDTNQSAFELRLAAFQRLDRVRLVDENANDSANREEQRRLRAILNRTFRFYYHQNRVNDSATLRADQQVAAATARRAPNVTALLVASDARLARTAVTDANRTLARLEARNVSFDAAAVREEIQQAKRAIDQAEHVRERAPVPVAAIAHYRRAWNHAQHALDLMDAATEPEVTITGRTDPVRNGSVNYTVRGRVFDVRPHRISNVTITVNGHPLAVGVLANDTPATRGAFGVRVTLDRRIANITVTTTDSGQPFSSLSEPWEPRSGRDRLRLDGDGLPDTFEMAATGTDLLAPDSDATSTAATEGGNGILDGAEDLDGDGLANTREYDLDTDPLVADTDGDDLSDGFEVSLTGTSPVTADSDGNGTGDGAEDPDRDGLANAGEERAGTHPGMPDIDGDGLTDGAERRSGTDPTRSDTDGDGLTDGVEPTEPFETDPLDEDTDGDGVLDGNETYTTTVANASLGTSVSFTGEGNVAADATVTDGNRSIFGTEAVQEVRASTIVRVEVASEFDAARVSIAYDADRVADERDLVLFRYDPAAGTFRPIPSTVHPDNDTVTARPSQFSTVVVLNGSAWLDRFDGLPSRWTVDEEFGDLDDWTCAGTCAAAGGLGVVASGNATDGSGVGSLLVGGGPGSGGDLCPGFGNETDDGSFVGPGNPTGPEIQSGGSGNFSCPGDDGGDGDGDGNETDGDDGSDSDDGDDGDDGDGDLETSTLTRTVDLPAAAETATNVTVVVEGRASVETEAADATVRVEHGGEASFFTTVSTAENFTVQARNVTNETGGDVTITLRTEGSAQLVIDAIRVAVDSDDDGLTDPVERTDCIPSGLGCHPTDPHDADSDGDTLEDGREANDRTVRFVAGQVVEYYDLLSEPDTPHSDGDGLNDSVEVRGWDVSVINRSVRLGSDLVSAPLRWDYNNRTTESIHVTADPLVVDTDGDGAPDDGERFGLHTDPGQQITYLRTMRHQQKIVDALYQRWKAEAGRTDGHPAVITQSLHALGLVPADRRGDYLADVRLDDASDDFDFVTAGSPTDPVFERLLFHSQDRLPEDEIEPGPDIWVERTDTWFSNSEEVASAAAVDAWDPDSDDDGLTDGQEAMWVTKTAGIPLSSTRTAEAVVVDEQVSADTAPDDPDTDGDGYWDGWIGVYGVGRSENVVLYMEHLQTGNGIEGSEIVQEQTGVHRVNGSAFTASAHSVNLTTSDGRYHSNVHVGELRWGSSPTNRGSEPDVNLDVEVDYLAGHNPFNITNRHGETVVTAVEKTYELYGIDLDFHESDRIRRSELRTIPKGIRNGSVVNITPFGFNQHELILVENRYHDDEERLHMFWGTRIRDDRPKAFIDRFRSYGTGTEGLTLNNGAPGTDRVTLFQGDWGAFVASDALDNPTSVEDHQKAAVHEIGHVLGIGWADDAPLSFMGVEVPIVARHGREVYSGNNRGLIDQTPEKVGLSNPRWSPMTFTNLIHDFSDRNSRIPRLVFGIEELSTADLEKIPSAGK